MGKLREKDPREGGREERGRWTQSRGSERHKDRRAGACRRRNHRVNNPTQMRQRGRGTKGRRGECVLEMSRSHFLVHDSP